MLEKLRMQVPQSDRQRVAPGAELIRVGCVFVNEYSGIAHIYESGAICAATIVNSRT